MQMAFVTIGGYVVATSPPVQRLIDRFALVPKTSRGAIGFIGAASMLASLLSWGLSLIFGGLLARAIARRTDLRIDYRAAGAAAYLGLGATWALGLSSSAAQLQANAASLPPDAAADHRRDPLHRDDLPLAVDGARRGADRDLDGDRVWSAPSGAWRSPRSDLGVDLAQREDDLPPASSPANGSSTRRCSPCSRRPRAGLGGAGVRPAEHHQQ